MELYAAFRSEREDWIESMVVAGLGFAFMPQYSVRLSGLLQRPLFDPRVERTVLLTDVRGRQRSLATKLFVSATSGFLCRETLHTRLPVSTVQALGVEKTTLFIEARFML